MSDVLIRRAEVRDLPALLNLYNHYIVHTPVTFDLVPRTLAERAEWFAPFAATGPYQCFVADRGGDAIGYACSGRFKEKAAYATTIETSIYLAPEACGQGLGKRLYETLFEALQGADIHKAFAGVTLPNPASLALHRTMGFHQIGTYPEIGRKFGRFWDVALLIRTIE